jgi:hypothetical protein
MNSEPVDSSTEPVENNVKQRAHGKRLGGASGKGFLPGRSGNPGGRPRTTGLIDAIRAKVFEIGTDGRTVAEQIAQMLVDESLRGKHRVAAATLILDRLEGRPPQQLNLNNITHDIAGRSDAELRHYLDHGRWPESGELGSADSDHTVRH